MLDRLARRYGTDPWEVLHWPPERVALATLCMQAGEGAVGDRLRRMADKGSPPMAVVDVGA